MRRSTALLLLVVGLLGGLIAAGPLLVFYSKFGGAPRSGDPNDWGVFGDFVGGVLNPVFAFLNLLALVYLAFEIHHLEEDRERRAREAEKRQNAVTLLTQFIADEDYIKARLIANDYLLPWGRKFDRSLGAGGRLLDFVELNAELARGRDPEDADARYYIPAIPSYFWLVDQARRKDCILATETLFDAHYAWYWVHVLRFRLATCEDARLYRRLDWMLKDDEVAQATAEFDRMIARLSDVDRNRWELAVGPRPDPATATGLPPVAL